MRAIRLLKTQLDQHPEDVEIADQLAQLYDHAGQNTEACILFERAAKASTSHKTALPGAWVNYGICQAQIGGFTGAMSSWQKAIQQNPGLENARLNLAVAHYKNGDAKAAREELEILFRFHPFSQRAKDLINSLP